MKRSFLFVTGIITIISFGISIYFGYQYYGENNIEKEKKEIAELKKQMSEIKENTQVKSLEKEVVKENNKEKVALLEVWQKELAKLRK